MRILVLNGSPRPDGNTEAMVRAFSEGAKEAGHQVREFAVCRMKIAGCLACEYCHTKGEGQCIQKDDMQEIYPVLDKADMIVLASPVYYHSFSGQLQCAINRIYALDKPKRLKKAALLLSSGSDEVYEGAIFEYKNSFLEYLKLEDMGVFTAFGEQNKSKELLEKLKEFGRSLKGNPTVSDEEVQAFLTALNSGEPVRTGNPVLHTMRLLSQEALWITAKMNSEYHTSAELRDLFSELTGKPQPEELTIFPPFHTDCGKNLTVGKNVFINSDCHIQDQGGITIEDDVLLGHGVTLATLNHGLSPKHRHDLYPAPIHVGKGAWIGAGAVILPGVTIGDYAVIAAGAVVTKDVPAGIVVGGIPAKKLRDITEDDVRDSQV